MRRFLYEIEISSGYPRTRVDAHGTASGDRDGNDRERDDGDHENDPKQRADALKPELVNRKELVK